MPKVRGIEENRNALPGVINGCCVVDEMFSDRFGPESLFFCSSTIVETIFCVALLTLNSVSFSCAHPPSPLNSQENAAITDDNVSEDEVPSHLACPNEYNAIRRILLYLCN